MAEKETNLIKIDLNQFKLHLQVKPKLELTLHFNSPSRRFYLSVIGLVVYEMKKRERINSVSLQDHLDVLTLLNKTVGAGAGSSESEYLLPRIYRKWKDALPDLENAPLFRVIGRKKKYDEVMERVYEFSEAEIDTWANLFEYKGSHQNVRLRLSIDRLGANLDDVTIVYGRDSELTNGDAWEGFIANLRKNIQGESVKKEQDHKPQSPEPPQTGFKGWITTIPKRWRWTVLGALFGFIMCLTLIVGWKYNLFAPKTEVVPLENVEFAFRNKPFIAVLPFRNISDDPKEDFFCDGLTDQLITGLSKFPGLFVSASSSVFRYKGKEVNIKEVSKELGVSHILEGSVRKNKDQIRITAQLIDTSTGFHLWAEIYDRELRDIFAVQDEITLKILNSLMVQLLEGQIDSYTEKYTYNLQAYLKFLEGIGYFFKGRYGESIRRFEDAHTLDPQYAMAYAWESWVYVQKIFYPSSSLEEVLDKASDCGQKCLALDDKLYACYMHLGVVYLLKKEYDKAISAGQRAVKLNPNSAYAATCLGIILSRTSRYKAALKELEKALRLSPVDIAFTWAHIGCTYLFMGRTSDAITTLEKAVERTPHVLPYHIYLAVAYSSAGRFDDARLEAAKIMKIRPNFSMKHFVTILSFKDKAISNLMVNGLLKAGFKLES